MDIIKLDRENLARTAAVLRGGGLVIYPSDTVYGALVDASNEEAVGKLIALKNRPAGKPISIFVSDMAMMGKYVTYESEKDVLFRHLLPGPFTVILDACHKTSVRLESERGTLGIRIPSYPWVTELVARYGSAVTATSANLSGRPPHYSVETLIREFPQEKQDLIDLVVDAGKLPRNKPSTIIDLTRPQVKILRQGDVGLKDEATYVSRSPSDTEKIARHIVGKKLEESGGKPLVFILRGDMGAGKTVFVRGAASLLGVSNIISPTFVIYYEYDAFGYGIAKFVHADLFNIEEPGEFGHLGLEAYLQKGNIMFVEWGEKLGEVYSALQEQGELVHVDMSYIDEGTREIRILAK